MSYHDECAREFWAKHDFIASLEDDDQPLCAPTNQAPSLHQHKEALDAAEDRPALRDRRATL